MLAEYKKKTNIGVGFGILASFVGQVLVRLGADAEEAVFVVLGALLSLGGAVLFIWGCSSYAKGKGHHGAWGFLGLLSLIGLIILVCFPDKHK